MDKQAKDFEKEKCEHFHEEICPKLDCKKDCKYYGKSNCRTCIHQEICHLRTFSFCEEDVKEKGCDYYIKEIPEGAVVLTNEENEKLKLFEEKVRSGVCFTQKEWFDYCNEDSNKRTSLIIEAKERTRKETAEKFAVLRKYITEQFHHYHEIRDKAESDYKKEKEEVVKSVLNNDWHRADAIMFILEKVGIEFDEIAKEITEGV